MDAPLKVAVVIPCFRVRAHALGVIESIDASVARIYVIDDSCPEGTGEYVRAQCTDQRVTVLFNPRNLGVGGAVMRGYEAALSDGMDVIVKVDGDGQMDPRLIPKFVAPIAAGEADYAKGNRFFNLEHIRSMPGIRIFGNTVLSFMTKLSSGYWDIFDPTNGFTAIHREVAGQLPLEKISQRYFFETDMLFRLNTLRAVVVDVPMDARYGSDISNLRIPSIVGEFLVRHLGNLAKRIFYNYYLRGMSIASFELPLGILMLLGGLLYGSLHWARSAQAGVTTPPGTVMISAILIIVGVQFILAFINYDIANVPQRTLHRKSRS